MTTGVEAEAFNKLPVKSKWLNNKEVVFSYDGTFEDSLAFSVNAVNGKKTDGVQAPEKFSAFPVNPEGAVNLTYSPDSTRLAFTRDNDLYVVDIESGKEHRLTFDGTDLILNGYASWVYFEEIFGRPTKYKAFWWSPDGTKLAFYRFDNTQVPLFPIYSPFGQDGSLRNTRYPKAGERNPEVSIGIADLNNSGEITWADFDPSEDQYFGTPFWGDDSKEIYISREPRIQNTLDLYAVNVADGSKRHVYHEEYKTWLDWITGMIFTRDGLYMARSFETGWEQIYFLSYDGQLKRLTDGPNWKISLVRVDEKTGDIYFTAKRDASVRVVLYCVDKKGNITAMTDPDYMVQGVNFSPDGKYFTASYSNALTPSKQAIFNVASIKSAARAAGSKCSAKAANRLESARLGRVVADMAGEDYNPADYALPQMITLTTHDGFVLPASIVYPKNFDPKKQYPVHMDIYGGPDTPMVYDRWVTPNPKNQWWSDNEIIEITADCRAAGHNGRAGLDMIYCNFTKYEVSDFIEWAEWLQSLPYVKADKIGVEGFSFGGTMTSMLLFRASDKFHYGVAGGGVYDWALYDTHYTERFMETPQTNPDGYHNGCALNYVEGYPTEFSTTSDTAVEPVMLKITHGTGDDNVHFQNTLQLIDKLQEAGKNFDFMIYPDGMHGYHGYQGKHFLSANHEFWLRYLKN